MCIAGECVLPKGSGQIYGLAIYVARNVWTASDDRLFITTARQPVALDVLEKAPLSGRLLCVTV